MNTRLAYEQNRNVLMQDLTPCTLALVLAEAHLAVDKYRPLPIYPLLKNNLSLAPLASF